MPAKIKSETFQITFKLDEQFYRPLSAEADGMGVSPNIAARQHVERAVTGDRSALAAVEDSLLAVQSEVAQLRNLIASAEGARSAAGHLPASDLNELRLDLAAMAGGIIAELRPQATQAEIVAWIKRNFLRKES